MMLEQQRAAMAFEHVEAVKKKDSKQFRDDYGGMALRLSSMVRSAGLCQALHFIKAKAAKKENNNALAALLDDLAKQLHRVDNSITNGATLCKYARTNTNLAQYLRLTREALATMHWYSRLVRAELDVDPTEARDR